MNNDEILAAARVVSEDKEAAARVVSEDKRIAERINAETRKYTFLQAVIVAGMVSVTTISTTIIASWRVESKVDSYHHEVNSMKDELVESVKKASRAEGVKEGKAFNKDEN